MSTIEFSKQLTYLEAFLHNFALRLTKNPEKAKDLVQDTSLRAFRYKDKFKAGTNFKGWVATVMRNTFINQYRKQKKRRVINEHIENFAYALEGNIVLPNAGEANLRMQEINSKLDQIGDLYRIPFLMHFKGYEYKEISEQLGCPIGTVKSRIYTARQKMKQLLSQS
jgi:RNA polymerase sigma factor (sigma-70 family)